CPTGVTGWTAGIGNDYDSDGYYSDFSISFDFDTHLSTSLVYAVLYVSTPGGPWIEYAVTSNFLVGGSGGGDAYTINATLDNGYQTGYYDHYIEVYDAYTDEYLAGFGPQDSHVLHGLPFESTPFDHHRGIASVSLNFTGTGAIDSGSVGALALGRVVMLRRRGR
ncbi:MAG: choice-of-anchor H family protein, partial [Pseudomonadota bacterium]